LIQDYYTVENDNLFGIDLRFHYPTCLISPTIFSSNTPRLQDQEFSTTIKIKLSEYLKTDDPILNGCEIALQDFVPVLDDAKDEVLYIKIKPEDKTVIYHLTAHPDTLTTLREISLEAKSKGSKQQICMLKKKLAGTLKVKKGRHPNMDYLE